MTSASSPIRYFPFSLTTAEADGVSWGRFGNEDGAPIQTCDARPARGDAFHPCFMDGLSLIRKKSTHGHRTLMAYVRRK